MNRILSILLAALVAATSCNSGTIWKTGTFALHKDGIVQTDGGRFRAYAPDSHTLVSDYPDAEYPDGQWHQSRDLSRFAAYEAPSAFEEAIYNMSLEESENAVEPDSTLRTGRSWAGVWTRDVSYSTILAMSHIQTEAAKKSLMHKVNSRGRIIQDTGTGGSWPVSTDRIIWTVAAWEIYKVTGDREWLETIYPIIKRSLEDDILTDYNPVTGMVKGESSYLDWREQEYPLWMSPSDIYNSENLGTNCVHYQALRILATMERMTGGKDAKRYDALADGLAKGLNDYLWLADKGFFAQYLYGRQFLSASPRSETLGEALAVLWGIADAAQAESICSHVASQDYGTSCFFPNISGIPPYHNDAMWPFVQAYWMQACAAAKNEKGVLHSIACIWRNAGLYLTNKENMVIYDGTWQGTEINSSNMLWSLSGNLSIVYSVLFGMKYQPEGLEFAPFVPRTMEGVRKLSAFPYRNALLDITLEGYGNGIEAFYLDDEAAEPVIPGNISGSHSIRIVLNGKHAQSKINMVQNTYSPDTPVCLRKDDMLNWETCNGAKTYRVLLDGKPCLETTDTFYRIEKEGEYQVVALSADGIESFASEPVNYVKAENIINVCLHKYGKAATAPYNQYDGKGYLPLSLTENLNVSIPVQIAREGDYAIDFLYANANGSITTHNKCAIRTLWDGTRRLGVVVLPQCGEDAYGVWKYSSPSIVHLQEGEHLLRLSMEDENINMNIDVNSAAICKMRLIRVTEQ